MNKKFLTQSQDLFIGVEQYQNHCCHCGTIKHNLAAYVSFI